MKDPVCILLDGSLEVQEGLLAKCKQAFDLKAWGGASQYYCKKKSLEGIVLPFDPHGRVIFYGSNDYHHLTYRILREIKEPLTVVVFDRHTECEKFLPGRIYCGSWVYDVLKLPNVDRVLIAGVDSDLDTLFLTDLFNPILLKTIVDLKALDGRALIFPCLRHNIRFLGKRDRGMLDRIIKPPFKSIESLVFDLLREIRTDDVYISIDKDVLSKGYSSTDWGSGRMSLPGLIKSVEAIASKKNVLGIDVCGDVSGDAPKGLLKRIRYYANTSLRNGSADARKINETTNLALLESFGKL